MFIAAGHLGLLEAQGGMAALVPTPRLTPSPEVRQRIINGRLEHLEDEIRAFEKAIRDLGGES